MDAKKLSRSATGNATPSRNGRNPDLPIDLYAEAELLTRALAPDVIDEIRPPAIRCIATAAPGLFHHPLNAGIAAAIAALHLSGQDPTRRRVIDHLTETTPTPASAWRAHVAELTKIASDPDFHLFVSTETVDDLAEHLERHRRQRLIMVKAAELEGLARVGTDWLAPIEELAALGRQNGAVISASTLEIVDFDALIRGDPPEIEPFWLRRTDGKPLLYPGRIHDLHAEPTVGKTWIAAQAVIEVFAGGGNALYLDLEDSGANLYGRLLSLGVNPALLAKDAARWRYINPVGGFDALELTQLFALVDELAPDLIVIDGVAEALARDGYDENVNADVIAWAETVPRPLARTGAAVLLLDHVKKDPTMRARGARGAGAKLALIDGVSYELRLAHAYSRHRGGLIRLIIAKDRVGQVGSVGETIAEIRVEPYNNGDHLELIIDPPPPDDGTGFRPTGIMQALSERLEAATKPLTADTLLNSVRKGRRAHRQEALAILVAEGYADELPVEVPRGGTVYLTIRPFREVDDADRRRQGRPPIRYDPHDDEPI